MSETTNLKLFKHDNPSTNENQFDVTEALNENWDKIDEFAEKANDTVIEIQDDVEELQGDNETNKDDIANLKTENEELKAENERLRQDMNALPSNTAEGEYITLTDSADSRFNKFKVLGKSTQKTRSGKNILYVADKEETINNMGITYSVKNGIITLNGTSTGSHYITFTNSLFNINEGDYTISTKVLSGSYSGSVGKQVNIDFSKKLFDGGYIDDTVTVEVQNQQENVYLALYVGSNAIFNNYQIIIQLEEGSVATEIEQYGVSPSPQFPSEIQNVEGNINIITTNENLF